MKFVHRQHGALHDEVKIPSEIFLGRGCGDANRSTMRALEGKTLFEA
jgi:hypothetical protein